MSTLTPWHLHVAQGIASIPSMLGATDNHPGPTFAPEVTAYGLKCAERELCEQVESFTDWLAGEHGEAREMCAAFSGPISTDELLCVLLNDVSSEEQLVCAARELRSRFLADKSELVQRVAREAMNG
jgi:hypothetical protein